MADGAPEQEAAAPAKQGKGVLVFVALLAGFGAVRVGAKLLKAASNVPTSAFRGADDAADLARHAGGAADEAGHLGRSGDALGEAGAASARAGDAGDGVTRTLEGGVDLGQSAEEARLAAEVGLRIHEVMSDDGPRDDSPSDDGPSEGQANPPSEAALLVGLGADEAARRQEAARALGARRLSPAAIGRLAELAGEDPAADVRLAALGALGLQGSRAKHAAPAVEAATRDDEPAVAAAATETLRRLRGE